MATQSVTLDCSALSMKLCHAKAIADLLGSSAGADALLDGTVENAGDALCTLLDEISEMIRPEPVALSLATIRQKESQA
ncbi:MAG: hypothetical protein K0M70_02915 [Arenimonas sp.]|uniref:hypothetical protein n=1 Tax=Arenimonas sp. TaxID=1872635 RepID=UPI0025BDDE6E|nr:hypothetical protein [Arenimonas sp.]MBW8366793.1 hypothetical protein [Arenimonas sp.]